MCCERPVEPRWGATRKKKKERQIAKGSCCGTGCRQTRGRPPKSGVTVAAPSTRGGASSEGGSSTEGVGFTTYASAGKNGKAPEHDRKNGDTPAASSGGRYRALADAGEPEEGGTANTAADASTRRGFYPISLEASDSNK